MRVAIAGASGLIGTALAEDLRADGHDVVTLVRRAATSDSQISWDPSTSALDPGQLSGVDALVNLAGAPIGDKRWTEAYKREIRSSRVDGTATLAEALASATNGPRVFVNGSAIGYYGDRGDERLTERSRAGTGFLSELVTDWEAAAAPAAAAGVRVVNARTGLVASSHGGAWERLLTIAKLGLAGRMGSGKQFWSFISLADQVRALRFLIETDSVAGPVNLTAPHPVTNREATAVLARTLGRPSVIPAPALAIKTILGEFSVEVLSSKRVLPAVLSEAGFTWTHPRIEDATAWVVAGG